MLKTKEAAAPKAKPEKKPRPPKAAKPTKPVKDKPRKEAKAKTGRPATKPAKAAKPVKEATWKNNVKPTLVFLPPKVFGARTRKKHTRKAMLLSAGMLGVMALSYLGVSAGTAAAQDRLDEQNTITAQHQTFLKQNAAVQDYYDGFIKRKEAVSKAFESDVAYSKILKAVSDSNKVGAKIEQVTRVESGEACASDDPFAASVAIGCLTITGRVDTVQEVGQFASDLGAEGKFLTDPYATSATKSDNGTAFELTIGYTEEGFSFKGAPFAPTPEELASIAATTAAPPAAGAAQ